MLLFIIQPLNVEILGKSTSFLRIAKDCVITFFTLKKQ